MATQLLNADADLVTIQDLLGHGQITTTQRYCWVANLKVQRDYYKAMEVVLQRTQAREEDEGEGENMDSPWRRGGDRSRENKACLSGHKPRAMGAEGILSILPEGKESGDEEKGSEQSRSNAKEKGSLMMDSPYGAVGEGGPGWRRSE
jgi:hypothetical protein